MRYTKRDDFPHLSQSLVFSDRFRYGVIYSTIIRNQMKELFDNLRNIYNDRRSTILRG